MNETLLKRMQMGADDNLDMVVIRLGDLRPTVPYQTAFKIAAALRMGCKQAARYDRAPATFWRDMDLEDLNDSPRPHNGFRRSRLVSNVNEYEVRVDPPLVGLFFDDVGKEVTYEDGIRLHQMIRRAGRRAKAWAGDISRDSRMLGNLTDGEEDYRLGLGG
jgi:hypothetical protein